MNVKNGEPTFIEDFRENVREAGFADQVTTLRAPSKVGLRYLNKSKRAFDLILIDGDHSYAAVVSDLRLSRKLLAQGGTLSGGDWNWPGGGDEQLFASRSTRNCALKSSGEPGD